MAVTRFSLCDAVIGPNFARVVSGGDPTKISSLYVGDSESDQPTTGFVIGDLFVAQDTARWYKAVSTTAWVEFEALDRKAVAGGYAGLDSAGRVPVEQLPVLPVFISDGGEGEEGLPGPPGLAGATGAAGADGAAGPIGASGPPGVIGEDGEEGPPGPPGVAGATGATGTAGADGAAGATGATGPAVFLDAEPGEEGLAGPPGPTGTAGAAGADGAAGATGATGPGVFLQAEQGEEGPLGPTGPTGAAGATGTAGTDGATGAAGPTGPAAFLLAEPGEEGMIGPPGATGATGAAGSGATLISGSSGAAASGAAPSETLQILTANATANLTTTLTTVMTTTALPIGTYLFEYFIVWQSATATVGVNFSVDYTGTVTRVRATRHYQSTGAAAATGVADGVAATLTGQLVEHMSTRLDNGSLGPNTGVDTINADEFDSIRGILVVSTSADLLLKHASETATSTQVMADTMLRLTRLA